MSRRPTSKAWIQRHINDPFVQQARREGYRARSAYKLAAIESKFSLFKRHHKILDLGAAPGGWTQVALEHVLPEGMVVALDRLPMAQLKGARVWQKDVHDADTEHQLLEQAPHGFDGVISDMAPNTSGIRRVDQLASEELAELALDIALKVLRPGGFVVLKIFQGPGLSQLRQRLQQHFSKVSPYKPPASRSESPEFFLIATGRKASAAVES